MACLRDGMRPHRLDVADAASIGREILESTRERRRRRDLVDQLDLLAGPKASLIGIFREAIDWDANRLAEQVGVKKTLFRRTAFKWGPLSRTGLQRKGRVVPEHGGSRSRLIVLALLELEELHRVGAVQVIPFTEIDRLEQASVDICIQIAHLDERACCRNVEVCWNDGTIPILEMDVRFAARYTCPHCGNDMVLPEETRTK
jgi:hypothetical protein